MKTEKVRLTEEKETLLATLYGRAWESRSDDPVLRDENAEEIVDRIDYDFRRLKMRRGDALSVAIRAKYVDRSTAEMLAELPGATVLHLGCGLDSRVVRIDPAPGVEWYDVDYPEVIELRRRLYPAREGYHMIGSSVTDSGWLQQVPGDRPAVVVAEGLVQYLREDEFIRLVERLRDHFPRGQLAFDAWNSLAARVGKWQRSVRATGATLGGWGIDDPRELEQWVPGLEFAGEVNFFDVPEVARHPLLSRTIIRLLNHIPPVRRMGRILRYRF